MQDLDEGYNGIDDKKASLLMMNFSIEEVEFSIKKTWYCNLYLF